MLTWWRRRRERQKQVIRDADNLMALFGEGTYSEACMDGPFKRPVSYSDATQ